MDEYAEVRRVVEFYEKHGYFNTPQDEVIYNLNAKNARFRKALGSIAHSNSHPDRKIALAALRGSEDLT